MVAPHLAVIAGQHHQGGGGQAGAVEVVEEPAQLVVDLALGAVVGGPHLAPLHLVLGGAGGGQVHEGLIEGMGRGFLRLGRRPGEGRQVVGVVEIVVAGRIAAGRVGSDERGVDEEGLLGVPLQPSGDLPHHEGGLGVLGGEPGGGPGRPVPIRSGESRRRLVELVGMVGDLDPPVGQPRAPLPAARLPRIVDHGPEAGQHLLVRTEPGIVRGQGAAGRGWCRYTRTAPGRSPPPGPAGPHW